MLNALLWNLLLTAGLAIVLAAIGRLPSLGRRPAFRHWLWLLLLAKLVTPPLIAVPLLSAVAGGGDRAATATPPGKPAGRGEPALDWRIEFDPAVDGANLASAGRGADVAALRESPQRAQTLLLGGLLAVSLIGTCVLWTVHGVHAAKLCRWLRRVGTEDSLLAELCADVASSLKIRGVVRSCVVDAQISPLLWGWRRPLVAAPRQLIDDLSPQQLRGIVAHELAHFVRRDSLGEPVRFYRQGVAVVESRGVVGRSRASRGARAMLRRDGHRPLPHESPQLCRYASESSGFHPDGTGGAFALASGMGSRRSILRRFEMIGETQLSYRLSRWMFPLLLALAIPMVCIPVHGRAEGPAAPAAPDDCDVGGKQEETVPKSPKSAGSADEIPGLDPKIKELGKAVQKRMNAWSDQQTLTLKEGQTGRMKVKKNVTPVAEIFITPRFAEKGVQYGLKGVDAAGKTIAGTATTSPVYAFGQPASMGLGTTFHVDGKDFMAMIQLKATRQGDKGVVVEAKAIFMRVATPAELEAMLLASMGKRGRVKADFMKIDRWIWDYRNAARHDPKSLAELNKPLPKDYYSPTGEEYHYEVQRTRYILSSCGPDGIYGNDDDEIEITDHRRREVTSGVRKQLYPLPAEKAGEAEAETEPSARPSKAEAITQNGNETVLGERPQGKCSISGKVVSAATGKPVNRARMYLFYNITCGVIFSNTADDGTFTFKDIPKGPFSLQSSHTAGYQDVAYNPEGKPGKYPPFSLQDGEHRTGIVLKAKQACRISGKIMDENGKIPEKIKTLEVLAWLKMDNDKGYQTEHAIVNRADGSYSIDGLDGKPVYVMAINWRAAKEGNACPPIYYPGVFSRSDAKRIAFDKERTVENINITLKKTGGLILEGTVLDEAGKPVPEAFVVAHRRDMLFDFVTAYTDNQGHYQIQGLGDGRIFGSRGRRPPWIGENSHPR